MWWLLLALAQDEEPPPIEPAPTPAEWQRLCAGEWSISRFTADLVHTTVCYEGDRGATCRTVFGCEGLWRLLRSCGPAPMTVGHPSWPVLIVPGRAQGPRGEVLFDRADVCAELTPRVERSSWVAEVASGGRILSIVGPLVTLATERSAGGRSGDRAAVKVVDLRGGDAPSLSELVEPQSLLDALRAEPTLELARNRKAAAAGTLPDLLAAMRWNPDVPSDIERALSSWAFESWDAPTGRVVVRLTPDAGLRSPRLSLVPSPELARWLGEPGAVFLFEDRGWRDLSPPW